MNSIENKSPDELYESVKKLIYKICHNLSAFRDIPFDELLSEAHSAYMKAVETYNGKAAFSSWVYMVVFSKLRDYCKRENRIKNTSDPITAEGVDRSYHTLNTVIAFDKSRNSTECQEPKNFFIEQLLSDLQEDAQMVISLAIDVPKKLQKVCEKRNVRRPCNFKAAIRETLVAGGWESKRVSNAFTEIQSVMGSITFA